MIGDWIISIREFWNRQTCGHKYKWIYRRDNGDSFEKCTKCDRIK